MKNSNRFLLLLMLLSWGVFACSDSPSGLSDSGPSVDGMGGADVGPPADVGVEDGGAPIESRWVSMIALPGDRTCAVSDIGRVECWGRPVPPELPFGPPGPESEAFGVPMEFVDGDAGALCGRSIGGLVYCWGARELGIVHDISGEEGGRPEVRAAACFLRPDQTARCASLPMNDRSISEAKAPTDVRFSMLALGQRFGCGIRSDDRRLVCWGDDLFGVVGSEPAGEYKVVSGGSTHACAVSVSDELQCWGAGDVAGSPSRPREPVTDVAVGGTGTCARLASTGRWVCWNRNVGAKQLALSEQTPTASNIEEVSLSSIHACGRQGDAWLCWGDNEFGQLDIPEI